jgi:hypothetical protein
MSSMSKRVENTVPVREELDALVRHLHHLQREHQNEPVGGSTRRHIEGRLLQVRERFERLLAEWVHDEDLREAWHAYAEHHAPEPDGPPPIRPVVFRGVSDAGSIVEVRRGPDAFQVMVDGALYERVVGEKDFAAHVPPVRFRLRDSEASETFEASRAALDALADFLGGGDGPPWEHASELLADGIVDTHFALTPRGRRALAGSA